MLNILEGCNITLLRNQLKIIKNINFSIKKGGCLILLGPNGSGKSTFLKILINFLKITLGNIWFFDNNLYKNKLLLEKFYNITSYVNEKNEVRSNLTVYENLFVIEKLHKYNNLNYTIEYTLQLLNIKDKKNINYFNLSQGQQRKIGLAKLFLLKKRIWILDEPTTNLDKESIRLLEKLINIHRLHGGIVIIATHTNLRLPYSVSLKF